MVGDATQNHHGSHHDLLWMHDSASMCQRDVDALIVPTIRSPAYLKTAANLAARLACPLVTLHSRKWTNPEATARQIRGDIDLIAIDVCDHTRLGLPDLKTSLLLDGTRFDRRTDTSAKRNLGLVLSRLVGWERIAFLDDDIDVPDPDDLTRASALLDTYNAVGLAIGGFPDNSVVCHAYRAMGGEQRTFIGGGALVVGISCNHSFFPNIYNEDWFYLLDAEKGVQRLAMTGSVIQRPYDPFRTPDRARTEELGDVLAEGAFWLLDDGLSILDANQHYWTQFIAKRKRFIESLLWKVQENIVKDVGWGEKTRMAAALKAALGRLEHITPALCLNYMQALTEDREKWQSYMDSLPTHQPLGTALDIISELGARPMNRQARHRNRLHCR